MRKNDAIYLRKSRADIELEKDEKLETLAKHKKILLNLSEKQGLNVVEIYEEVISGESVEDRPEMKRLLKDIHLKKYRSVVVMEIERLARGATKDQGIVAEAFKFSNTKIITPSKTYNPQDQADEEYFEFALFMSRREYKTIQRRLMSGRLNSVKEGNHFGVAPYGYDVDLKGRNNRTLKENNESQYVRLMFEWAVNENLNCGEIAKRLTSMGVPTRKGKREWYRATVRDILHNVCYIGKVRWQNRKLVKEFDGSEFTHTNYRTKEEDVLTFDGKHKPLIDEETFYKAKQLFQNKSPFDKTKLINVFAGILKCSICGRPFVYQEFKTRPNVKARMAHTHSYTCKPKSAIFSDVLYAVTDALKTEIENFEIKLSSSNNENEIENFNKMKSTMETELSKLEMKKVKLFDNFEEGLYTKSEFIERKKLTVNKIDVLKLELKNLQVPIRIDFKEKIVTFHNVIDSLHDEKIDALAKNNLLKSIIERIDYTHNNGIELDIRFHN